MTFHNCSYMPSSDVILIPEYRKLLRRSSFDSLHVNDGLQALGSQRRETCGEFGASRKTYRTPFPGITWQIPNLLLHVRTRKARNLSVTIGIFCRGLKNCSGNITVIRQQPPAYSRSCDCHDEGHFCLFAIGNVSVGYGFEDSSLFSPAIPRLTEAPIGPGSH